MNEINKRMEFLPDFMGMDFSFDSDVVNSSDMRRTTRTSEIDTGSIQIPIRASKIEPFTFRDFCHLARRSGQTDRMIGNVARLFKALEGHSGDKEKGMNQLMDWFDRVGCDPQDEVDMMVRNIIMMDNAKEQEDAINFMMIFK